MFLLFTFSLLLLFCLEFTDFSIALYRIIWLFISYSKYQTK